MSVEITTAQKLAYGNSVTLLCQQKGSKLRPGVVVEPTDGKWQSFEQIGATAAQLRTSRHADTPLISTPHDRRWAKLADYDWADLVDPLDVKKIAYDPQSKYVLNAGYAMGRAEDAVIVAAYFGTAYSGENAGTSNSFDSNNVVAVGGTPSGLSLAKLISAKAILDNGDVDSEIPRFIAVTGTQTADLLGDSTLTSADYNTVKALVKGEINEFLGFTFINLSQSVLPITTDGNAYRRVMAWSQYGLGLAVGSEPKYDISIRADKNNNAQVYYNMSMGAVRTQEEMCVEILCNE